MWERDWVERNNSATTPMVRGGIHLTAPAFLPTAMLKEMTATEEQFYKASLNFPYLFSAGLGDLEGVEGELDLTDLAGDRADREEAGRGVTDAA